MSIFQIIAILFGLFMLYVTNIHAKKKTISPMETSFWYSSWAFFIVVSAFPDLLKGFSSFLNFARVFDFLVVLAFMVLTTVTFFNYFRHKSLEDKIEKYVRVSAFKERIQR